MAESIEYEITVRVTVPAGQSDGDPRPFEEGFYLSCPGSVVVEKAVRITPAISYGGPR